MNYVLKIENLSKSIDDKILFENINLSIPYGSICCLIGDNGAGKSVFIDCILGFQTIDQGKIMIANQNINNRKLLRINSGIVSSDHENHLELLNPKEYFELIIGLYNLKNIDIRLEQLTNELNVNQFLEIPFANLSFGSKKKIQLIGNLLFEPPLLVCDEIFEGLDEKSVQAVKNIFKTRANNKQTTFFTTHIKQEAEDITTIPLMLQDKKIFHV